MLRKNSVTLSSLLGVKRCLFPKRRPQRVWEGADLKGGQAEGMTPSLRGKWFPKTGRKMCMWGGHSANGWTQCVFSLSLRRNGGPWTGERWQMFWGVNPKAMLCLELACQKTSLPKCHHGRLKTVLSPYFQKCVSSTDSCLALRWGRAPYEDWNWILYPPWWGWSQIWFGFQR